MHQVMLMRLMWDITKHAGHNEFSMSWGQVITDYPTHANTLFDWADQPCRFPYPKQVPMDAIETTYISMLGSSDGAQKHNPTLTRQWIKDKILSELPTVKSVRQKERRKTYLIYCPEACEEDMVHSSLMQSVTSEMENTMMIYKAAKVVHKCQNIMYAFKTRRQVQHTPKKASDAFRTPKSRSTL